MTRAAAQRGMTLIEVLIAVTLLSLLAVGMLFSLRIGLNTYLKTGDVLMEDRRVLGAQRALYQEVEGILPVMAHCGGPEGKGAAEFVFFQGEAAEMRLISAFSLNQGWRGRPQALEFAVLPGENGDGVRLIVNESPYAGPQAAGKSCTTLMGGEDGSLHGKFPPVAASEHSFVLADKLAYCRFSYLTRPRAPGQPNEWKPVWAQAGWPLGVRVEMAPLTPDTSRLRPITVTAPIRLFRYFDVKYDNL